MTDIVSGGALNSTHSLTHSNNSLKNNYLELLNQQCYTN